MSSLHDKRVVVPADEASNNIVFVCKNNTMGIYSKNLTFPRTLVYTKTSFHKAEILANHKSFVSSMNSQINEEIDDLPNYIG